MRRFYYIGIIILTLNIFTQAQNNAQQVRVSRGGDNNRTQTDNNQSGLSGLSVRAQNMNEQLTQEIGDARWMRVITRELDLTQDKNAPLYFPVQELNGMKNLFTNMFQLASEGKINVYKYLMDYESFEDDNILPFKEMLDNFGIYHEEIPASGGRPARYVITASDIPSQEVRSLYIKEAWYFDQNNSVYDVKILAICPIAYMITEMGDQRQPMFWAKYEDVRPYVKGNYIMTSNINNAKTFTVDDFFRRRMYDGEIIMTENMMNLAMQQLYPDPDTLKIEQQRIEDQLVAFNDSLWIKPDTTQVLSKKDAKAAKKASSSKSSGVSSDNKSVKKESATKQKQPKVKQEKAAKSAPARSIRR